jgi:polyisoprenoid-binding protein YceI
MTTPPPTAPTPPPSGSTSRRRRRWWYLGGALALVVVLAGFGIWYFVFRDDSPSAVNIESATESLDTRGSGSSNTSANGVDGTWTVDGSIGSFADFTSSFAGYRVQEELAGIGAKTAVGRTPAVTGTLTIAGKKISKADFQVDMTTLESDEDRRDGAIRDQAIETTKFPTATFELTRPIALDAVPADGTTISVDATGDLTLHGVTKEVTIPLRAELNGDVIAVTGEIDIPFADYDIDKPSSFAVVSIADDGILEVQLFFTRQA